MANAKQDKFDDYLGMPVHRKLKQRIERIGLRKSPTVKTVPMARSILERAVDLIERDPAALEK